MGSAGQKILDELQTEMSLDSKGNKYLRELEEKIRAKKYEGLDEGEPYRSAKEHLYPITAFGGREVGQDPELDEKMRRYFAELKPKTLAERRWDLKWFSAGPDRIARKMLKAEVGSNKAAMEAREKKYAKMYKKATMANYAKLKEDMNKVNTDELDKYFNKTKSVMDADLFHWIDKTNKGINMRVIPYGEGDKDYSTIRKDVIDIMEILGKDMEYEGSEMKVLDVLNILGRKVYKKKAGSIVSDKRREVSAKLKTIGEEAVRAIMSKDSDDFKIPRLFKLKLKQNNLKLKKELYNLFRGAESPLSNTELSQIRIVERTEETIDELTEIEKTIFSKWKQLSDVVAELAKPEIKERKESFKRKIYAKALSYVLDFEEAIEPAKRSMDILQQEVIAYSEMIENPKRWSAELKDVSLNEERLQRKLKGTLRLLKKKQSYIGKIQKEIDKWQGLIDKIEKDLEE